MPCHRGLHQTNNLGRNENVVGCCGCGGMVDAADSKSASGDRVGVQVPSAVPLKTILNGIKYVNCCITTIALTV